MTKLAHKMVQIEATYTSDIYVQAIENMSNADVQVTEKPVAALNQGLNGDILLYFFKNVLLKSQTSFKPYFLNKTNSPVNDNRGCLRKLLKTLYNAKIAKNGKPTNAN